MNWLGAKQSGQPNIMWKKTWKEKSVFQWFVLKI